ncbi:MAG: DUF721 domain-containing protein [Actinomycetales bacterium]
MADEPTTGSCGPEPSGPEPSGPEPSGPDAVRDEAGSGSPRPPKAGSSTDATQASGADLVRETLGRARAAAAAKGLRPGGPTGRGKLGAGRSRRRGYTGAGPDSRDPQTFGASIGHLVTELGWQEPITIGGAMGRWGAIVGDQVAAHSSAESFDEGVLTVVADSTAWASQLRLMAPQLLAKIARELGDGVVTRLVIKGPTAPSWNKGRIRASGGRGPRDTYG